jgi:molybdopterin converting factor small subunit
VYFTSVLRDVSGARSQMEVTGTTVGEILNELDRVLPGIRDRLCTNGRLDPSMTVLVDGLASRDGLDSAVGAESEIYFLPIIGGG